MLDETFKSETAIFQGLPGRKEMNPILEAFINFCTTKNIAFRNRIINN